MTIFTIPEGKVVDRIELEAGEGKTTLNIIYKEDKPKPKDTMVLVETEADTWLYRHKETGTLMRIVGPLNHPENYIPLRHAEEGEFVVLPHDTHKEALRILFDIENCLSNMSDGSTAHEVMARQTELLAKRIGGLRYYLEGHSR